MIGNVSAKLVNFQHIAQVFAFIIWRTGSNGAVAALQTTGGPPHHRHLSAYPGFVGGAAICRIFSEKTGSCATPNLERKRVVTKLRKADSAAKMTGSDRGDAAIGIL